MHVKRQEDLLIKVSNLVKRTVVVSGVAVAVTLGATATAHAVEPATAASASAMSTTVPSTVGDDGPVTIQGAGDCTYILEYVGGYRITTTRYALCNAASLPFPGAGTRIAVCSAGLTATGVLGAIAVVACTAATG